MRHLKVLSIASVALVLLACSSISIFAPTATPVPTATDTPAPTATSTATLVPTPTFTPTETPKPLSDIYPSGEPVEEWNGFPIMPGALTGKADGQGYSFTIRATPEEIEQFYVTELGKLGWQSFASGAKEGGPTVLMMFQKGTDLLTIMMIPTDKEGEMMVVMVK